MAGYVSSEMHAGRVLSHGKITSLATAFSLAGNVPFSLFLMAKSTTPAVQALTLSVKLYQDAASFDCPFNVNAWTEPAIISLDASNAAILNTYDLYWGAGQQI